MQKINPFVQKNIEQSQIKNLKNQKQQVNLEQKPDSVELSTKVSKSNNNKFDISECIKNFNKGILSPLTAVIEHPIITLATVALTTVACTLVPVLGTIMAIGFGGLSVFQLGKGVVDVVKNCKNKEYDKAEKSFNEVGQGTVGVLMTATGLKQNAKAAKEAKLMSELGVTSLDSIQKSQIASEVKNMTKLDALKEIASLFTSKNGLKAIINQFKPSNIVLRGKEAYNFLFKKEEVTKVKKEAKKFVDTTEGKRRAAMSSEEIEAEIKALYKEAFDEYGIPEELRPELKISHEEANKGGSYVSTEHTLTINENSYREGYFDLPNVMEHEATHTKGAILRQRLPQEEKSQIAVEYLLDKIQNGDKSQVVTGQAECYGLLGSKKIEPPKMNAQMKADFSKLAKEKLYTTTDCYIDESYIRMVKPLVESNPEFVSQYSSIDEATEALANYARSHNFRYKVAMNNASGFNTTNVDTSLLKELSEEEKIAAIKSFKEGIDCLDSNVAGRGGILGIGSDYNQYQFTPEEVLAQQKGNNFEISKLNKQLETLRSQENYDITQEARLLDEIKKCELTIEYKTKGKEWYRLFTESNNHPENIELKNQVELLKEELFAIDREIKHTNCVDVVIPDNIKSSSERIKYISDITLHNPTNEYSIHTEFKRPEMGASYNVPLNTTVASDIIGDDIEDE